MILNLGVTGYVDRTWPASLFVHRLPLFMVSSFAD